MLVLYSRGVKNYKAALNFLTVPWLLLLKIATRSVGLYLHFFEGNGTVSQKMLKTCQSHTRVTEIEKQGRIAECSIRKVDVSARTYRAWGTNKSCLSVQGHEFDFISKSCPQALQHLPVLLVLLAVWLIPAHPYSPAS